MANKIMKQFLEARICRVLAKFHGQDRQVALINIIDKLIDDGVLEGNEFLVAEILEDFGYSKVVVLTLIHERKHLSQNDRHKRNKAIVVDKDWKVDEDVPLAPSFDMEKDCM